MKQRLKVVWVFGSCTERVPWDKSVCEAAAGVATWVFEVLASSVHGVSGRVKQRLKVATWSV